jgi:hypothetical protein
MFEKHWKTVLVVVALAAIGYYFWKKKSATTTPASNQLPPKGGQAGAASTPAGASTNVLLTSDQNNTATIAVGATVVPTNNFNNQWDPAFPVTSTTPGILTPDGKGGFVGAAKGTTQLSGSALDASGGSYPMTATVVVQ